MLLESILNGLSWVNPGAASYQKTLILEFWVKKVLFFSQTQIFVISFVLQENVKLWSHRNDITVQHKGSGTIWLILSLNLQKFHSAHNILHLASIQCIGLSTEKRYLEKSVSLVALPLESKSWLKCDISLISPFDIIRHHLRWVNTCAHFKCTRLNKDLASVHPWPNG